MWRKPEGFWNIKLGEQEMKLPILTLFIVNINATDHLE